VTLHPPAGRPPEATGRVPWRAGRRRRCLARGVAVVALGVGILAACSSATTTAGGCGIEAGTGCVGTYMKGAYLPQADLFGSDLSRADLRYAVLAGANLQGANLNHTNLQFADLRHANLEHARLTHADLRGAELGGALLAGATLTGATGVTAAELGHTTTCRTLIDPGVWLNQDC
jgi:uncharacterized protein YjbI with pentapeptide repeats